MFAYWYSTTGGICNAPMCIDHLNKVTIKFQSTSFVRADNAPRLESPLSIRATISLFRSAKNPNFNTVVCLLVFYNWRNLQCANVYRSPRQGYKYCKVPVLFGLLCPSAKAAMTTCNAPLHLCSLVYTLTT